MTEWFTKVAGESVAKSNEDPNMLLFGDGVPDWVRLPAELGGVRVRVEGAKIAPCAKCGVACRHLVLPVMAMPVREIRVNVAECRNGCGFVWYKGGA